MKLISSLKLLVILLLTTAMRDKFNPRTQHRLLDPVPKDLKHVETPTVVGLDEFYDCTQKSFFRQVFERKHLWFITAKYAVQPDDIHYATGKHPLSLSLFFVNKKSLKLLEIYKETIEKYFGYTELFGLTSENVMQRNSLWRNMAANGLQKQMKFGEISVVDGQIVCGKVNFGGSIVVVWQSRPRELNFSQNQSDERSEIESINVKNLESIDQDEIESIKWNTEKNALEVWVRRSARPKEEPQSLWNYSNASSKLGDEIRVTPDLGEIESWRKCWKKSASTERWNYALVFACDFTDKKIKK